MRDVKEFSEKTSAYELFTHLYVRIVRHEITTFAELLQYTESIPPSKKKEYALRNAFILVQKLNWGFFSDLSPDEYPKLWRELIIQDQNYLFAGNLKRNMTITNVYVSFIDIHGYTAFCIKSGNNTSMLQLLDEFIEKDIKKISRENHVISRRARGDEIILVGISALDIVKATIAIADYFSRRRIIKSDALLRDRSDRTVILPDMSISAGIAGGKKYTPLIITSLGDLSGTVVNTAARLQAQANRISSNSNRILITQHISVNFLVEAKKAEDPLLKKNLINFFYVGSVSFKGVNLTLFEIIIDPKEKFRMNYQNQMIRLIESLKKNIWTDQVFINLIDLICQCVKHVHHFEIHLVENVDGSLSLNNGTLIRLAQKASGQYLSTKEYSQALDTLERTIDFLSQVPGIDYFVLIYARNVLDKLLFLKERYQQDLNTLIDKEANQFFSPDERKRFNEGKAQAAHFDTLHNKIAKRIPVETRKILWAKTVQTNQEDLSINLYFEK
jgi:class 3 adenylate cyclase